MYGQNVSWVENELILKLSDGVEIEKFFPSQLGGAVLASALSPDEGLVVFSELQKARRCFVLENELHIIYMVSHQVVELL